MLRSAIIADQKQMPKKFFTEQFSTHTRDLTRGMLERQMYHSKQTILDLRLKGSVENVATVFSTSTHFKLAQLMKDKPYFTFVLSANKERLNTVDYCRYIILVTSQSMAGKNIVKALSLPRI